MNDYSDRIKRVRSRLKLTQIQFAERLGVSFASVNRWENGQAKPASLAWRRILAAEEHGLDGFADFVATSALGGTPIAATGSTTAPELERADTVALDFGAKPEVVRVVAEAERLGYGHLFNPAFAAELSLIEPLPHQRIAVYEHMLPQSRLRFLLADDAGAGKTIMTGLYVRELLSRRLVRRVLVVPPAGLVGNWERELRVLFGLTFRIVTGADARAGNPFAGPRGDLVIVSVDALAGARGEYRLFSRLQDPVTEPYDLVVFDEAHKLAADRMPSGEIRRTERYKLAEALAGVPPLEASEEGATWQLTWACQHLLLLTATPHMGRDFPYFALWRLLEPEVLSTPDAFAAYPAVARRKHFVRRVKEEMVRLDGSPIYPTRISDTLTYELTRGPASEQALYDEATDYIQTYYNRARILNRSAAQLAMSVFQRRLASSTHALLRSLERRLEKLNTLVDDLRSGRLTADELSARQRRLDRESHDVFDERTADEERTGDREENEGAEDGALGGVLATSLADLLVERSQVQRLCDLARRVHEEGHESKFERLREVLRDPRFQDEKLIVFTEHRDTLEFLTRRLEGLGFAERIAQIHGGMDYRAREEQIEFFRRPASEGGASYLLATDAAGEGINLQHCWLMINYDIPWNPARLEQRLGRIHRYGQQHDPVVILNLVAAKTREGRVLRALLDKLELIRQALRSDKVFDVVGRVFQGVSLKEYMELALTESGAAEAERRLDGLLTDEQVLALEERERRLYGDGGDIRGELTRLREGLEQELYRRLLPGHVRRFVEQAAPLLGLGLEGDPAGEFGLRPLQPRALDPLLPVLESYPLSARSRFVVHKPAAPNGAIFLRPGDPFFEGLIALVRGRLGREAARGGVFIDPTAEQPYLLHLIEVVVRRAADHGRRGLEQEEVLERSLLGIRQGKSGDLSEVGVEHLLLLRDGHGIPPSAGLLAARSGAAMREARAYAEAEAAARARHVQARLLETVSERQDFLERGYDFRGAELAAARGRLMEKSGFDDPRVRPQLARLRDRQRALAAHREEAIAVLRREPDLVEAGPVAFIAHALVVQSSDSEDRTRHDANVEAIAVQVATAWEEAQGARVQNVSTPVGARLAGLCDHPGFDLLSTPALGESRAIEVKGRGAMGDIELTLNEWAKACTLRERYWLYVVYGCGSIKPRLLRIRDPFAVLLPQAKGSVLIGQQAILKAAEAVE